MALNDEIANELRARTVDLLRYDAALRRDVLAQLKIMEKKLVEHLQDSGLDGLTPYQLERTESLLFLVRETIATSYRDINQAMAEELTGLAADQVKFAGATVDDAMGVRMMDVGFTETQLGVIARGALIEGSPAAEWWAAQAGDTLQRFTQAMREGVIAGETNDQLVRRVVGTRANGYADGIMATSRRNAMSLVRTSVQSAANTANLAVWERKENDDLIKALVHLSTLDSRTTLICIARSGKQWTIETHQPIGHELPFKNPPVHWQCRSILTPVIKSFAELGIDATEVPKSTRASMDGQVPEDITFDEWMKQKGPEFQDKLLGPGRAKLWREGKITLTDLVDQSDRPLTLAELRGQRRPPDPGSPGAPPPPVAPAAATAVAPRPTAAPAPPLTRAELRERLRQGESIEVEQAIAPPVAPPPPLPPSEYVPKFAYPDKPTSYKLEDFAAAGIKVTVNRTEETIKMWNEHVRMPPADFHKRFLPGFPDQRLDMHCNSAQTRLSFSARHDDFYTVRQLNINELTRAKRIENEFLEIEKKRQGGGLAKQLIGSQFDIWRDIGATGVDVHANLDIGGYSWARYGFVPDSDSWGRLKEYATNKLTAAQRTQVADVLGSSNPKALWALSDSEVGKPALLNSNWYGKLDFTDAEAVNRFYAYVAQAK